MDSNNINHYLNQAVIQGCALDDRSIIVKALGDEDSEMSAVHRGNMAGHFVASLIMMNENHDSVLMIHHKTLNKLLFPGGHIDSREDAMVAAFREGYEETGYSARPLLAFPIDIDTHEIPNNPAKNESQHLHHDLLFVGMTNTSQFTKIAMDEISYATWVYRDNLLDMGDRNIRIYDKLNRFFPLIK